VVPYSAGIFLGVVVRRAGTLSVLRWISGSLVFAALAAGTVASGPMKHVVAKSEGYYILAADFHVHSFPGDWATLAPWDVTLEARRRHLDVISLTSHNHVLAGYLGRWMADADGPLVIVGEEIVGPAPHYHLLAVGIRSTVDWRKSAADAISDIHDQGGIAIAAHPIAEYSGTYDSIALQDLDGAEVLHPIVFERDGSADELREFSLRGTFAAIGDSDYRGLGPAGVCRTYVFAREFSEQGVLEAIRERHTVVYDRGRYYGDTKLIELAIREHLVPGRGGDDKHATFSLIICIAGGTGLAMAILMGPMGLGLRVSRTTVRV
jgi:hypothetical protein